MTPVHRVVPISSVFLPDWGWRQGSAVVAEKLAVGMRRHGQLVPLVVRALHGGGYEVVKGRTRLAALQAAGVADVHVMDVGQMDRESAQRMALDLELRDGTDYVRLARAVYDLVGGDPDSDVLGGLAAASPFTRQRLSAMVRLLQFDWSQFAEQAEEQQAGFTWDCSDLPAMPPQAGTAAQAALCAPDAFEDEALQAGPPAPVHEPPVGAAAAPEPEHHPQPEQQPEPVAAGQMGLF